MREMYSGGKAGCLMAARKQRLKRSGLYLSYFLLRATEVCRDGQYLQFLRSSDSIWEHSHLSYFAPVVLLMTLIHVTFKFIFFKKCHLMLKLLCICTISFKIV